MLQCTHRPNGHIHPKQSPSANGLTMETSFDTGMVLRNQPQQVSYNRQPHPHEVAIHSDDQESVAMVRIRKGMKVCPRSTGAADGDDGQALRDTRGQ
jgi:hypothetical protein